MQALISKLETIPIAFSTLQKYKPKHCRVILYDNLPSTAKELFGAKYQTVICLYQMHDNKGRTKDGVGHYCLIMKTPSLKRLRYFSSYGLKAEDEIHITHSKGKLLKILGRDATYNRRQLQRIRLVQTCRLHALIRAYLYKLSDGSYYKLMKQFVAKTPDEIVSIMSLAMVFGELR